VLTGPGPEPLWKLFEPLIMAISFIGGENHKPAASYWPTLSHNVVPSTPHLELDSNSPLVLIGTDCIGSCKSNYLAIMTTMALATN
jgi:hypothetical protein